MRNCMTRFFAVPVLLLMLFPAWGCGELQEQVTAEPKKENMIEMKASDYKFEPNNIQVRQGESITFKVENVTDKDHNITIKDPQGKIIQSLDIPPKKTVELKTTFSQAGTYELYCDKPFHSTFGMKGRVVVK